LIFQHNIIFLNDIVIENRVPCVKRTFDGDEMCDDFCQSGDVA